MSAVQRLLILAGAAAITVSTHASRAAESAAPSMYGFTRAGAVAQAALERRFDGQLNAAEIGTWLKQLSAEPNHVGAPHNKANAEFVRDLFKSWGWQADIETFYVLYPTPKRVALELIAPKTFTASLREPPIAGDATSTRTDGLPPYNAYGADGDVIGDLVYVNYGMDDDYKELARRGVDVKGKIAIVRYGGGWRGLKPKLAYQHGAIGCLIYSDPKDDGYGMGDTYPVGGWRPADAVQRGSVADMPIYAGDPLTPGVGATKTAKRLSLAEAPTVLKIPVLPISYADARQLLESMTGPVAPETWRGALPLTYHIGPGPARVHLSIASDWGLKPVYDVIARIPGQRESRRMGDSRQSSRRLGCRGVGSALGTRRDARRSQGNWRAAQDRLETQAHVDLRELGRRRARPARLDRVGRDPRGGAAAQGSALSEFRHQHAWVSAH